MQAQIMGMLLHLNTPITIIITIADYANISSEVQGCTEYVQGQKYDHFIIIMKSHKDLFRSPCQGNT